MTTNYLQWVQSQKARADEKRYNIQRGVDTATTGTSIAATVISIILSIITLLV